MENILEVLGLRRGLLQVLGQCMLGQYDAQRSFKPKILSSSYFLGLEPNCRVRCQDADLAMGITSP